MCWEAICTQDIIMSKNTYNPYLHEAQNYWSVCLSVDFCVGVNWDGAEQTIQIKK